MVQFDQLLFSRILNHDTCSMHSIFLKEYQHKLSYCVMLDIFLFLILFRHNLNLFISYLCFYIHWPFIHTTALLVDIQDPHLVFIMHITLYYTIVLSMLIQFFSIPHFTRHYILSYVEISKFLRTRGF